MNKMYDTFNKKMWQFDVNNETLQLKPNFTLHVIHIRGRP